MASDLNSCCFIGRIGKDAELKTMKNGEMMAVFSLAVGESWMGKNGERANKTEWINIVAYRKLAEVCAKYLAKGSQVYVSGKFTNSKYIGKDGIERNNVQIVIDKLQMLGNKVQVMNNDPVEETQDDGFDQDIPF